MGFMLLQKLGSRKNRQEGLRKFTSVGRIGVFHCTQKEGKPILKEMRNSKLGWHWS
jgi:hypothetical protein